MSPQWQDSHMATPVYKSSPVYEASPRYKSSPQWQAANIAAQFESPAVKASPLGKFGESPYGKFPWTDQFRPITTAPQPSRMLTPRPTFAPNFPTAGPTNYPTRLSETSPQFLNSPAYKMAAAAQQTEESDDDGTSSAGLWALIIILVIICCILILLVFRRQGKQQTKTNIDDVMSLHDVEEKLRSESPQMSPQLHQGDSPDKSPPAFQPAVLSSPYQGAPSLDTKHPETAVSPPPGRQPAPLTRPRRTGSRATDPPQSPRQRSTEPPSPSPRGAGGARRLSELFPAPRPPRGALEGKPPHRPPTPPAPVMAPAPDGQIKNYISGDRNVEPTGRDATPGFKRRRSLRKRSRDVLGTLPGRQRTAGTVVSREMTEFTEGNL